MGSVKDGEVSGWRYYNHAMVPTCAPHEMPDLDLLADGSVWKVRGGIALFAKWTVDFDCGHETNWWYMVKDEPFDIESLKSNRRYEIRKGDRNFEVKIIDPREHFNQILSVQEKAFAAYPAKYRPKSNEKRMKDDIDSWGDATVFGAFFRESGEMAAYAVFREGERMISFDVLKADPFYERLKVNAATIYAALEHFRKRLEDGAYVLGGERAISHETNFQDYLVKLFGFRKCFCRVRVQYRGAVGLLVAFLYPFHGVIKMFDHNRIVHQICGVMRLEEARRSCRT